jgi:hypothetical protein
MSIETTTSRLVKKTGVEKSRWTVPLSYCPCASFKTIFRALNYEIRMLLQVNVKHTFYSIELLHTLYVQFTKKPSNKVRAKS